MWQLFQSYYDSVTREIFTRDLGPKSDAILLRDTGDGSLQGFSTMETYERTVQGRALGVLYSGDTLVARGYWGQTALQRAWLACATRFKALHPLQPVYWFLIAKGYRTYLLLSRNFPTYWPRHDRSTPPWERAVIHELAREKFGSEYRPHRGVIEHAVCPGKLRRGVAPIEDRFLAEPDIRYFQERNPGHGAGDELCCLGRIDLALWTSYMFKLVGKRLRHGRGKTG
jgi:hypothetical protein